MWEQENRNAGPAAEGTSEAHPPASNAQLALSRQRRARKVGLLTSRLIFDSVPILTSIQDS